MANKSETQSDIIVIGSGGAGLTAALTALKSGLNVQLIEASTLIGGATALSEGMIWAPNSPAARGLLGVLTVSEEREAALSYLRATSGNYFDESRAGAYLDYVNPMLDMLQDASELSFTLNRSSRDYYPEKPNATLGLRAHNPKPISARKMDRELFARLRPPLGTMQLFSGMSVASADLNHFIQAIHNPRSALYVARLIAAHLRDRLAGWPRGTRLANGGAIVACLAQAIRASGGDILTATAAQKLILENGRVSGVVANGRAYYARLGVILTTGGLSSHAGARTSLTGQQSHIPIPATEQVPHLTELVEGTGAALDTSVAQPVLWAPTSLVPNSVGRSGAWPHFGDRAKPGVICVGPDGRRFTNEAQVYHDFVPAMIEAYSKHPEGAHCWVVTDHRAIRRYGLGPVGPFPVRLSPYIRAEYLLRDRSLTGLARQMGVAPDAFEDSVRTFNTAARRGEDPQFGRGQSVYDQGNGDPEHAPNASLGALDVGPFYAIRLWPGDIGTFVGLKTNAQARVITEEGLEVPGLWAAGNAASPMTGGTYAAAGLTIGAALTFGYLAAKDAAQSVAQAARAAE